MELRYVHGAVIHFTYLRNVQQFELLILSLGYLCYGLVTL